MPTVMRIGPYRFYFYSGDGHEPRHIHVERDDATIKFWIDPVRLDRSVGFGPAEIGVIHRHVVAHAATLRRSWNEHFGC